MAFEFTSEASTYEFKAKASADKVGHKLESISRSFKRRAICSRRIY